MNSHHRRAQAHAGDFRIVTPFVFAAVGRHIGRCASHIKANQLFKSCRRSGFNHADNAGSGSGQDAVFAAEVLGKSEPTVALHEQNAARNFDFGQSASQAADIVIQDRSEICIGKCRFSTTDEFYERLYIVRNGNLLKSKVFRNLGDTFFVRRVSVTMHQTDRDR